MPMVLVITAGLCITVKILGALEWAPLYRSFMFIPAQLLSFFFLRDYNEFEGVYTFPGFVMDYSCSGIHFFMVALLVTAYAGKRSVGGFLPGLVAAYLLTLAANTARIALFLKVEHFSHGRPWLHEAIGTLVFVSFLLSYYLILNHRRQNAAQR
ncbi:MAG: hypothetical protein KF713_02520 [Turneriella sp.]|nr:hypothetical protein [Turneriella sp.]